jgi:hypothetical protein
MYYPILRPAAQRQLKKIEQADLVIGLPSYKNPQTAAHVARIALQGAHQFYPHLRTVLINADAGRQPTTRQAILSQVAGGQNGHLVVSGRYEGLLGQGSASAALLDAALALDAQAIIILDSHNQAITPRWIAGLAHLILEDKADLVMPRYRRWTSPDGAINDLLAYPLLRALWGQAVRFPTAPDFALSARLATAVLDEDIWATAVAQQGLPSWLVSYGIIGPWRVAQSAIGERRAAPLNSKYNGRADTSAQTIAAQFCDLVSVIFNLINRYKESWQTAHRIRAVPTLTRFAEESQDQLLTNLNDVVHLHDQLALGWIEYRSVWQTVLDPDDLTLIEALASLSADQFHFPADLWARMIYDFAVVFNKGEVDPVQVVESLLPLFQGRQAAFLHEVAGLAFVGREGTIGAQAVDFEEMLPYLKKRWNSYTPN